MWLDFKREHGRNYGAVEDEHRFQIFVHNLRVIDQRNAEELVNGGEECHGITKFTDITQEEFEMIYLGASQKPMIHDPSESQSVGAYPTTKDWTGILTTPIKDQGSCGSCWAFSAMEQVESDAIRTKGWCSGNPSSSSCWLSAQQINSCDTTSYGCNGGWTEHAFNYVIGTSNGLETNTMYPYTSGTSGVTGSCQANGQGVVGISSYTMVSGETAMTNYVGNTGPLSVCLCAQNWNFYTGGVMTKCCPNIDHCVQAVGYDTTYSTPYWKVRNQWGTSWGESGYIRLQWNTNMCKITNDPNWVTVK
jgi:C1A family cysteine protease